jgi:hypothetical protein
MAATITNRIQFPDNVVPLQLVSGSTQDDHVGCGVVTYTVSSSGASTLAAADFGLSEIAAAYRVDVGGASAIHTGAGIITSATDGMGFAMAMGPLL